MKKKDEAKYLDREWTEMNTSLATFLETGDQEHLHKFRVEIKKLRAMLLLFENASKENNLMKFFKPVKKIFKHAGGIREAYVNLKLSEHYSLKNEQFENIQQKIIEEGIIEFRNKGDEFFRTIKRAHERLKKKLQKIDDSRIAGYYKKQLNQIAVNLAAPGFTDDMHTNRKLIKILVYNHKLAQHALNGSIRFNASYLDKLQEAIGKWHDNLVAGQLFSSPELNDKPTVAKIKRVNSGVKRSISALAGDFLRKATAIDHNIKA
jgi:CHAD domain-containing protein